MVQFKRSCYSNPDGSIHCEEWLQHVLQQRSMEDHSLIHRACSLNQLSDDKPTFTGISCIQQGLAMAEILLDLHLDRDTIATALIYGSVCYAGLRLETVGEQLGPGVAKLLQGILKIDTICNLSTSTYANHTQIENIRKMLLAMIEDIRVMLIKLAERAVIMRTIGYVEESLIKRYAQETLSIYAPLANRLGIDQLKWELEDLSLHYLDPAAYTEIARLLHERLLDRENYIQLQATYLQTLLENAGIKNCKVYGRAKHIYSIYRKIKRKNLPFSEIYDCNALRILVNNTADCYTALGIIQNLWPILPNQFDDYIAVPKRNGYRSIHAVFNGPERKLIEIQIRTYQMHQESEHGMAAHWQYKEEARQGTNYQTKIAWLRYVLEWQKEVGRKGQGMVPDLTTMLDDRVYLLTPAGDIIDLPKGATSLDFAYAIHSEIGHRCRGAKVNGVITPLTYPLNTGEQIEILTAKQPNPSRDWLNVNLGYLRTTRARSKVQRWFKLQDYDKHVTDGQLLLQKECQRLDLVDVDQEQLAATLHFKSKKDMLAALGNGAICLTQLLSALPVTSNQRAQDHDVSLRKPQRTVLHSIRIGGLNNLLGHTANCCKPVPGDHILGFITQARGVVLHRSQCRNIIQLGSTQPKRLIEANWEQMARPQRVYPVDVCLEAHNCPHLVQDISTLFANERLNLLTLSMTKPKTSSVVHIKLTVEMVDCGTLAAILARLQTIPNVVSAYRKR